MASALSKTVTSSSFENRRSLTGVPRYPTLSISICPAKLLSKRVITVSLLYQHPGRVPYAALRGTLYDRDNSGHPLTARTPVEEAVVGKHSRTTKLVHKLLLRRGELRRLKRAVVCDDLMPAAIIDPGDACAGGNGNVLRDKLEDFDVDGDRGGLLLRRRCPSPDCEPGPDDGDADQQQRQPPHRAPRCGSTLPAV